MDQKKIQALIDRYGDEFYILAGIEAIRKSGVTNMFSWGHVKRIYQQYFPTAPDCYDEFPDNLMFNGIPEDLKNCEYWNNLVNGKCYCIAHDVPELFDIIDNNCPMEIMVEYDLKPTEIKKLCELKNDYLASIKAITPVVKKKESFVVVGFEDGIFYGYLSKHPDDEELPFWSEDIEDAVKYKSYEDANLDIEFAIGGSKLDSVIMKSETAIKFSEQ